MITGVPVLRAIPEVGEPYDDPSEDLLFMLLEDIEAGHGTFLILERSSDGAGQTYAQAERRPDGSYRVEHREGNAEHHFGTAVADMRAAHRLLTGWAFELGYWHAGTRWTQVTI